MPTFAELLDDLDANRRRPHSASGSERFAPIRSEIMFVLPRGEPFFEYIYPRLCAFRDETRPRAHFGIGNTRNLSIIAATRADAAILGYYNLYEQDAVNAVAEVAVSLYDRRGDEAMPAEFIEYFAAHPIQELLQRAPDGHDLHTDLSQELAVPESWLNREHDDGRFIHVLRLFARGRIGTIGLNIVDQSVFSDIKRVLESAGHADAALRGLQVQTVFLANLMYHLGRPETYVEYGTIDHTPRNAAAIAWDNLRKIASDDAYVIFAHEFPMDLYRNNGSEYFAADEIDGPPRSALSILATCSAEAKIPYLDIDTEHYCDWRPYHYATMGGALGLISRKLPAVSKENPVYGPAYPGRVRPPARQ